MTTEELQQAHAAQTPLYEWVREQLVTLDQTRPPNPTSCFVVSLHDRREKYCVLYAEEHLRPATAQELLELAGET